MTAAEPTAGAFRQDDRTMGQLLVAYWHDHILMSHDKFAAAIDALLAKKDADHDAAIKARVAEAVAEERAACEAAVLLWATEGGLPQARLIARDIRIRARATAQGDVGEKS